MTDEIYLAGDFSGIQRFVLRVKTAGKAQAKRLRARSFLLQLLEHATLSILRTRFALEEEDVLVQGGGGFLVRLRAATDSTGFDRLATDLQDMLWRECGGQMQVSLGWAATPTEARAELERRKRMPGGGVLQREGAWDLAQLSQPPLGQPCQVCGDFPGTRRLDDEDGKALHCRTCVETRRIGKDLTRHEWIRVGRVNGRGDLRVLGVPFELLPTNEPEAWRVGRWVPRGPTGGNPLTFEELSRRSRGDSRLAVLKADVDDMGQRVGEVAASDPSCRRLRSFSHDLHTFFGDRIREMLKEHWPLIYTLYAGGDDLLLVGPWDVVFDFASALESAFQTGPAAAHGRLTLSAGIALTPYRVPIRHAVERAEKLLDQAKTRPGKNRCATLGSDWTWDQHREVVANGKMIANAVADRVPRGLLLRLLQLVEASSDANLQAARWSYQVARNVPRHGKEVLRFRDWAHRVVGHLDERNDQRTGESAASLRYALLATRSGTEGSDA